MTKRRLRGSVTCDANPDGINQYTGAASKATNASSNAKGHSAAAERMSGGAGMKADAHAQAAFAHHSAMLAHTEAAKIAPGLKEIHEHDRKAASHKAQRDRHVALERTYR